MFIYLWYIILYKFDGLQYIFMSMCLFLQKTIVIRFIVLQIIITISPRIHCHIQLIMMIINIISSSYHHMYYVIFNCNVVKTMSYTIHFPGNGKFIPPIKMVIFLGDGAKMAASFNHINTLW